MIDTVTPSLAEPLRAFVTDSRVHLALVLESNGRVLAQHGFTRSVDVMSACALAAAIHASSAELGRQLGGAPFGPLHHAGASRQLFLAPLTWHGRTLILLAVFDRESSLGLVRHFSAMFADRLEEQAPPAAASGLSAGDFEGDLRRSLAALFGRT